MLGVSRGGSFKNILSIFLVSSGPDTSGLNGGSIYLLYNFSQSIEKNHGCFLISSASSSEQPNLLRGLFSSRPVNKLFASILKDGFISIGFSTMS